MALRELYENRTYSQSLQRMKSFSHWLTDLVFPASCGGCGRVDFHFCRACQVDLAALPLAVHRRDVMGRGQCIASGRHEGKLAQAIRAFKYNNATDLAEPLAERLISLYRDLEWNIDALIPVPLFVMRLTERGYNQSELLGQHMSAACSIPLRTEWLTRMHETRNQAELGRDERSANVKDAFAATEDVKNLSILLIDDVVTTGSTLSECASTLWNNGARAVNALTLSHAQ